ncbi:MAG: heme exporter protein CcmB [Proteobacteria bacterium]|nr:MAG: heme exporter protein CcmB [Pseudomonadota bacterium]
MTRTLFALIKRDLNLAWRQGGGALLGTVFFAVAVVLFPLGVGPEPNTLARIAAGVLWVAALLAAVVSLDRLFEADHDDGSLDGLALLPLPFSLVVAAKCLAHWLASLLPVVIISPFLGLMMRLEGDALGALVLALLLGTPGLSFIGAIGAALAVGLRRAGALLSLLVLPLYIPALIFGVAAVEAARMGLDPAPHLMLLFGATLFAVVIGTAAATAALKFDLE